MPEVGCCSWDCARWKKKGKQGKLDTNFLPAFTSRTTFHKFQPKAIIIHEKVCVWFMDNHNSHLNILTRVLRFSNFLPFLFQPMKKSIIIQITNHIKAQFSLEEKAHHYAGENKPLAVGKTFSIGKLCAEILSNFFFYFLLQYASFIWKWWRLKQQTFVQQSLTHETRILSFHHKFSNFTSSFHLLQNWKIQ